MARRWIAERPRIDPYKKPYETEEPCEVQMLQENSEQLEYDL